MRPTLLNDEHVLVDECAYSNEAPSESDVVLARHPYKTSVRMIKRICRIESDGRIFLVGDNPDSSTDSRSFGTIEPDRILGRVVSVFP